MSDEQDHGVIQKYTVRRRHDPSGKHDDCWFFVLDIKHDPLAREALAAYAVAAREAGYLALYADLTERLAAVHQGERRAGRAAHPPGVPDARGGARCLTRGVLRHVEREAP